MSGNVLADRERGPESKKDREREKKPAVAPGHVNAGAKCYST